MFIDTHTKRNVISQRKEEVQTPDEESKAILDLKGFVGSMPGYIFDEINQVYIRIGHCELCALRKKKPYPSLKYAKGITKEISEDHSQDSQCTSNKVRLLN